MTKLTKNEIEALQVCIDKDIDVEYMIDDAGQIMHGLPEMIETLGWSKHKAAAVIGSLESKGMGESDGNRGNGHIFWPSEEGYRAAYAALN